MNNTLSKGKEIKIPGPDHPITISPVEGKVRVTVAGRIDANPSAGGERVSTRLLLAAKRCGHIVARSDNALHLLSVQGRLHVLQHSHRRNEIGICRLDVRKAV